MHRMVILLITLLLFLTFPVSATYYVKEPSPLYEVKYSVLSNGTDALIHLEVLQWGVSCGMTDCWPEVFYGHEYLLFFDGGRLYLLNFTPAVGVPTEGIIYRRATFINGSWYVEMEYHLPDYSQVDMVHRFDTRNFCVEPVNVSSWFWLHRGKISNGINGWRIELQSWGPGEWGRANVSDLWIASSKSASSWSPGPAIVANSSVPVYFTLKKGNLTRNVTLVYLNATGNGSLIQGFWFPGDVKIVNVTLCEKANVNTSTSTTAETNGTARTTEMPPSTTKTQTSTKETKKGICGPGLISLLAVIPLILRRR
ncbi:CGP-CTERM sorting domain-containing protein [Thermococcus sp. JdF3]|uniref:CGP-CTERM sorting domain-containing protein n=1 Tax=Thermococcus sp. JdF3 TaxID=1638258 RepID=UPI00143A226D|nr:CGP-CTERM sorting domain-containing protein [Thermococcus sp. JdF3]NJE01793.1 CGP-CTERM sorting domain-containing protein [Thermococcus sp. JdF3]